MLFGICQGTSRTTKVWHTHVITYSNFMVIVEPWDDNNDDSKLIWFLLIKHFLNFVFSTGNIGGN